MSGNTFMLTQGTEDNTEKINQSDRTYNKKRGKHITMWTL